MRLGQTMACLLCMVRFAPTAATAGGCPSCRGNRVIDLARPQGREAAWTVWSRDARWKGLSPLPPPGAIDPLVPRHSLVGTVRVPRPIASPFRRQPCALFTVTGHAPGTRMADAGGVTFELHAGETHAIVELGDATVTAGYRPRPFDSDTPIPFLEERGAYLSQGTTRVVESLVGVGDRVAVEGFAEARPAPAGYRGTAYALVFRDLPQAPLVIRNA